MNLPFDDQPENPAEPVWGRAPSPVQAERSTATAGGHSDVGFPAGDTNPADGPPAPPPDPAWTGWDVLRLVFLTIVALFAGVLAVLVIARIWVYPHRVLGEIARVPLVVVAGQSLAYLLILAYMYVLVTRERRRPDFLAAIHWNFPSRPLPYLLYLLLPLWFVLLPWFLLLPLRARFPHLLYLLLPLWFVLSLLWLLLLPFWARFPRVVSAISYSLLGLVLSVALQILAHFLPMPKELPIDSFFKTPAETWALGILSVTLAPLMEELFFRGFLYPVLARRLGLPIAVFLTALGFALLHGAQLMFSWGPVLVIFLVGMILTIVRARTNSVAAGVLIHMAYNGTIAVAMFVATDGFRHLEKLSSQ